MHPSRRAQIAHLKADKAPSEVPGEFARSQQSDNQESVFLAFSRRIIGSIRLGLIFHLAQSDQCLPLNEDQGSQ